MLALLAAAVVWQVTASSPTASGSTAFATSRQNWGFSPAVQAKIDKLNAELDSCLIANGATRVPLGQNGWTYTDPGGRPSGACSAVQARVNAYANSAEVRAAVSRVLPAVEAYARCLEAHGVPRATHASPTAADEAAREKAHLACGGSTADAAPAG